MKKIKYKTFKSEKKNKKYGGDWMTCANPNHLAMKFIMNIGKVEMCHYTYTLFLLDFKAW